MSLDSLIAIANPDSNLPAPDLSIAVPTSFAARRGEHHLQNLIIPDPKCKQAKSWEGGKPFWHHLSPSPRQLSPPSPISLQEMRNWIASLPKQAIPHNCGISQNPISCHICATDKVLGDIHSVWTATEAERCRLVTSAQRRNYIDQTPGVEAWLGPLGYTAETRVSVWEMEMEWEAILRGATLWVEDRILAFDRWWGKSGWAVGLANARGQIGERVESCGYTKDGGPCASRGLSNPVSTTQNPPSPLPAASRFLGRCTCIFM